MRKEPEMKKYTLYFDSYECTLNEHFTFYATYDDALQMMITMADGYASKKITVYAQMYSDTVNIAVYEANGKED